MAEILNVPILSAVSPLLSIVIPTFNRQHELSMLLDQLRVEITGLESEVEILVSENCSTDQTAEMLSKFAAIEAHRISIRWFSQPTNFGAIKNLHFLVNLAHGKYIWAIGDDDALVAGKLLKIIETLRSETPKLLLVRTEGIGEWDGIPLISTEEQNSHILKLRLNDGKSAEYLFASGFLGSVIIDAQTWLGVLPEVEVLHETCYSNWAAVLQVASKFGQFDVLDTPCVRGNYNMRGASTIPAFNILVLGRVKVWASFNGTLLHTILKPIIIRLAISGWIQVALGKTKDVTTLREKLLAFRTTFSLLGRWGDKAYLFALISLLFPFPKLLDRVRARIKTFWQRIP